MVKTSQTVKQTGLAGIISVIMTQYFLYGRTIDQRIKGTPGITGLYLLRDLIDMNVCHLDVGLLCPKAIGGFKCSAVRRLI
jgi:hypothetical protein